jgi:hypothetical protein
MLALRRFIAGYGKIDFCQFHFGRYIKRRIAAEHFNSGRLYCFSDICGRRLDIDFKKKEQRVIMWLIVFMAGIVFWREKCWEKYNENQMAQPNA